MRRYLLIILFLLVLGTAQSPHGLQSAHADSSVTTPHATVRLISDSAIVKSAEEFWLAIEFNLKPGWHIYFENPGDSGIAPKIVWHGDTPRTFGPLLFPAPEIIPLGPLVNYGYNETALFPVRAKIESLPGAINALIGGELRWLICHEDCVPEKANLSLTIPFGDSAKPSADAERVTAALDALPKNQSSSIELTIHESDQDLTLELPASIIGEGLLYFFPTRKGVTRSSAPQEVYEESGKKFLKVKKSPAFASFNGTISGILRQQDKGGAFTSYLVHSQAFNHDDSGAVSPTREIVPPAPSTIVDPTPLALLLLFALAGGILLNLMPCVLPVLSLKVLSLCNQAHDSRPRQIALGLSYALGTISSLLLLAGILIALRSEGSQIGWGFQLQYPPVVGLLALFFFFIGLSFLGFFELQSEICTKAAQLDCKEGLGGAFLSGLLATIVATPCTAPFMGTAIGVALFRPWHQALLIFAALGLGIALPYLLLILFPRLRKFLPRPGHWMIVLKEFFAFPLFATSIWLLWILAMQRGGPGVILVLLSAGISTFGFWLKRNVDGLRFNSAWRICATLLIIFGVAIVPLPDLLALQRGEVKLADNRVSDNHGLTWEPFSPAIIEELNKNGELAYIDFTAAWCVTCQVNKALVFSDVQVQNYIKKHNVRLIRGDWTNQDPDITRMLASFGRASVPFNLIYGRGARDKPLVLPTVLTAQTVLNYLELAS